jgi:Rod binding domain-containing protein
MVLSNLLEDAMPDDGASFFGEGTAGGVWKSMLVEQIAGQMAKAGGIGIAAEIARGARTALADTGSGNAAREATKTLLIDRIQRGFVGGDGSQKAPKVSL